MTAYTLTGTVVVAVAFAAAQVAPGDLAVRIQQDAAKAQYVVTIGGKPFTTYQHGAAFADKPVPEGLRLRPELAEAEPVVSRDGKTYIFTIKKGFKFSD